MCCFHTKVILEPVAWAKSRHQKYRDGNVARACCFRHVAPMDGNLGLGFAYPVSPARLAKHCDACRRTVHSYTSSLGILELSIACCTREMDMAMRRISKRCRTLLGLGARAITNSDVPAQI